VVIGEQPPATKPVTVLGRDALSALNFCFLATTLAGALFEYFGNEVGACGSMLVFLIYGFAFRKDIPSIERFADSTYYQGFILTLFALIVALTGRGAESLKSTQIIAQFGVAVWTTFIGMTGRIAIIQFLTTVRDQDEEARQSIAAYVVELNQEVRTTLDELRGFRNAVVQSATQISNDLAEESTRNRKETSEAIKSALSVLVQSVERSGKTLNASVEKLTRRIESLEIPTDAFSGPIGEMTAALTADVARMRKEIDEGSRELAKTIRENAAIMVDAKGEISIFKDSLSEANSLIAQASNTTADSLAATRANLSTSAQAARGVDQLAKTAGALAEQLTTLSQTMDARGRSQVKAMSDLTAETTKAAAQWRGEIEELNGAIVDGAQKIAKALRDAGR
jgi:hypothetical protein